MAQGPSPARGLGTAATAGALLSAALAGLALLQGLHLHRGLRRARRLMAASPPFEARPAQAQRRVLLLGDSTGVGVGGGPRGSVGALLAHDHPGWAVVNACRSGARLADVTEVVRSLASTLDRHDLLLLHAGGNDVLRGARRHDLTHDARQLMGALGPAARRLVWMGPANIGHAPVFRPPLSWWLSHRTAQACHIFHREARAAGACFLDFYGAGLDDPFGGNRRRWYARDGVHPSADSYRLCYERLRRSAPWRALLSSTGASTPVRPRSLSAAAPAAAASAPPAAVPSASAACAR